MNKKFKIINNKYINLIKSDRYYKSLICFTIFCIAYGILYKLVYQKYDYLIFSLFMVILTVYRILKNK